MVAASEEHKWPRRGPAPRSMPRCAADCLAASRCSRGGSRCMLAAALMGGVFPSGGVMDAAGIIEFDDRHVVETGSMGVTLFIELWRALPTVAPLDPRTMLEWTTGLIRQATAIGAPFPVNTAL